ncbi:MAG: hypothetical protein R3246_01785 [Acidimicrobiia bacterium]|nr:hypothetical protein [Acidimicrobiia bacterium]
MPDSEFEFEAPWEEDEWWDDPADPEAPPSPWRRRVVTAIGVIVAAAMLAGPVWNIFDRATPPVSDTGLELCGFDYCVVQDTVTAAGFGVTMSRLANTFVAEEEAVAFAATLVDYLGEEPVEVQVVDDLDGRIAGQYRGSERLILLERPVRMWIVLHEVAHVVAAGHGETFMDVVIELAAWVEESGAG